MTSLKLESRPLYSIGTVARLTGIKPDTLRVWERRYGLGASQKSPGGRREYTQSDLEHLQIVAALLEQGTRIGDIANRDRRTLEIMSQVTPGNGSSSLPENKPRFLFIGESIAKWIDIHQGCISQVSAFIARQPIDAPLDLDLDDIGHIDAVVVECSSLDSRTREMLGAIRERTRAQKIIACCAETSELWDRELQREDITLLGLPLDPVSLGGEINTCVINKVRRTGDGNAGELVEAKPRYFDEKQLKAAEGMSSNLHCACPNHISRLIEALNEFEDYSSKCSVESWHEAAVHSCIYAYTNQARWLMEKALQAALEEDSPSAVPDRLLQ